MKRTKIRRVRRVFLTSGLAIASVLAGALPAGAFPLNGGGGGATGQVGGASGPSTGEIRVVAVTLDANWIALGIAAVLACTAVALFVIGHVRGRRLEARLGMSRIGDARAAG